MSEERKEESADFNLGFSPNPINPWPSLNGLPNKTGQTIMRSTFHNSTSSVLLPDRNHRLDISISVEGFVD